MTQGKVVYVNGDSFTEGVELADDMFPFYNRTYSLRQVRDCKDDTISKDQHESINLKQHFLKDNHSFRYDLNKAQLERRWTTRLDQLLDKKVINMSSQGGSSMYSIAFRTVADIHYLMKKGYIITDAIIQLTSPYRVSAFADTGVEDEPLANEFELRSYNLLSANVFNPNKKLESFATSFFNLETAAFNIYRWLHELFTLKHTLENMCPNIRVIFVDSVFYKNTLWPTGTDFETLLNLKRREHNHILDFRKEFEENLELSMLDLVILDESVLTSGLHLTQEVHDRFAFALAERYFS